MERDQARIILLAAKAASDRRCGYPDFVVRQPERVGERLVHVYGHCMEPTACARPSASNQAVMAWHSI